jgi:acyl-CoA reductase-like NAD-dependent aldehyde dehydrogenase
MLERLIDAYLVATMPLGGERDRAYDLKMWWHTVGAAWRGLIGGELGAMRLALLANARRRADEVARMSPAERESIRAAAAERVKAAVDSIDQMRKAAGGGN